LWVSLFKEKQAMDKTIELNPGLPEAHIALGRYHYYRYYDYDHALDVFTIAQKFQPNSTEVLGATALVQRRRGNSSRSRPTSRDFTILVPSTEFLSMNLV
jgi:cytochrome c-type biogenesis protein CcmH/NrfG